MDEEISRLEEAQGRISSHLLCIFLSSIFLVFLGYLITYCERGGLKCYWTSLKEYLDPLFQKTRTTYANWTGLVIPDSRKKNEKVIKEDLNTVKRSGIGSNKKGSLSATPVEKVKKVKEGDVKKTKKSKRGSKGSLSAAPLDRPRKRVRGGSKKSHSYQLRVKIRKDK